MDYLMENHNHILEVNENFSQHLITDYGLNEADKGVRAGTNDK